MPFGYRMSDHDNCCKDCKDRYVGCHADCERGKEAERKWREYKKSIDEKRFADLKYDKFKSDVVRKTKERSRNARVKR